MKATLKRFFSSAVTTLVLLAIYAFGLALATFLEKYHGTVAAKQMIYYSPVFLFLQFLLVVNFIALVVKRNLIKRKKWGLMITHIAFIVILTGALISHLFSEEGMMHIREGESSNVMAVRTSQYMTSRKLPFSVELIKFNLHRYPGSASPSSYESELLVHVDGRTRHERVYMNNVMDVKGYRFFQASYDSDEQGTILSVNKDVAGRNVTYTGYLLLLIGLILSLLGKNSRFMQLNRQLKGLIDSRKKGVIMVVLLFFSFNLVAAENPDPLLDAVQKYAINPDHAAAFGALPVQSSKGRMIPVNTFSSEILRKLHKSDRVGSLNSDQFLLGMLSMPEMWMRVRFIAVPNKELVHFFSLTANESAYIEMFDANGNYKLQQQVDEAYSKMPNERSRFDKDLLKLDEQINIMHQLLNRQMLNLFPKENDPTHTWYASGDDLSGFHGKDSLFVSQVMDAYLSEVRSALKTSDWTKANEALVMIRTYQDAKSGTLKIDHKKIASEIQYNKQQVFRYTKIFYLILGGLLLVFSFIALFKNTRWIKTGIRLLTGLVLCAFVFHMYGMGLRWYIGGYAPWSNSYETMVYVAWATVLAGILLGRRSSLTFALATLFGGIILFVSGLNWMDPQINPLVPVLKSPWLMFHVAVIVAAYGFFGISFLMGLTNLILMSITGEKNRNVLKERVGELSLVNEMSLWIGLVLMTVGTFLGAVWANESWGRYWGWDPKETWALITMVVYAIVLHMRMVKSCKNLWAVNLGSVLAFASVMMTFFGVNYLLSGMHSYGQNDDINGLFSYLYGAAALVAALGLFSYRSFRRYKF